MGDESRVRGYGTEGGALPPAAAGFSLSPPAVIERLTYKDQGFHVVREDLLPGGTKQRAAATFIEQWGKRGVRHFLYASPFCGFAQVALALVCRHLGYDCTIFAERDPAAAGALALHPYSELARRYGAEVVVVGSLAEAESQAAARAQRLAGGCVIPLGFNSPIFRRAMRAELTREWRGVLRQLPRPPRVLWLPVGSGTLAQLFSRIVTSDIRLHCVNVHVLAGTDERIQCLRANPRITLFSSPQPFAAPAFLKPRIPSNLHYDAKVWSLLRRHGSDGDVWWNVGP